MAAMGPPGGGRNPITQRIMRHFSYLSFTELEESSKRTIFGTILKSWLGEYSTTKHIADGRRVVAVRDYDDLHEKMHNFSHLDAQFH